MVPNFWSGSYVGPWQGWYWQIANPGFLVACNREDMSWDAVL